MENNKGLTLVALVITIIILLILAGVSLNVTIGDNGVLTKAKTVEIEYNKAEVLEELNIVNSEKYLDAYGKASKKGQVSIGDYYSGEKVIKFLLGYSMDDDGNISTAINSDDAYITELKDESFERDEGKDYYFIYLNKLKRDIDKYGKGNNGETKDYFYIKCLDDSEEYTVCYRNLDEQEEEIGKLQIQQSL